METVAPYAATPADRSGNSPIDDGSFAGRRSSARRSRKRIASCSSNALLVSAKRLRARHPIFVAGPQLGYYYPEIVGEMDMHGGGIDARGISTTGAGPYVFIGRGQDFSWSLTSASNDIIDIYVETLCGNSDRQYLFKGKCKQMTTIDAGVLRGAGGEPDRRSSSARPFTAR